MVDVAWRARAHELLREIVAIDAAIPFDDVGGWIGRELSRAHPPATVRHATGTRVLTLDPYDDLSPEGHAWTDEPAGLRRVTVGFDADEAIVAATAAWRRGEPEPAAVGWRLADGTRMLVTHGEFGVQARAELPDGASLVVAAAMRAHDTDDRVEELRVGLATPDGPRAVRRTRAWASTPGLPGRASVGVLVDHIFVDGEGRPVERWTGPFSDEVDRDDPPAGPQAKEPGVGEYDGTRDDGDDAADVDGDDGLDVADPAAMLDALVDVVAAAEPPARRVLRWSLRLHGPPPPLPVGDTAVEDASRAMLGTLRRAAAGVELPAPCAVAVTWADDGPWLPPLPVLLVVDRAFADAYRALPDTRSAAYELRRARAVGEAVQVSLVGHADDATLAAWLPLRHGVEPDGSAAAEAAAQRLVAVRRRLLELLLAEPWPAPWVAPLLPWLAFGPAGAEDDPYRERRLDPWAEIAATATPQRLTALVDAWPPGPRPASGSGPAPWGVAGDTACLHDDPEDEDDEDDEEDGVWFDDDGDGDDSAAGAGEGECDAHGPGSPADARPVDELAAQAAASRPALRALLEREGLAAVADRLAGTARYGFELGVRPGARSRIGGPPVLPAGAAWPLADGEPLTFVAAIDLAELPGAPEPLPVPSSGWLLVYVLLTNPDPDEGFPGFVEGAPEAGTAKVLHVADGARLAEVVDPPPAGVLRPQPVHAWEDEFDDDADGDDADGDDADDDDTGADGSDAGGLWRGDGPDGDAGGRQGAPSGPAAPVPAYPLGYELVLEPPQDYDVEQRLGLHPSVADRYERIVGALPDRVDRRRGPVQGTLLGSEAGPQGVPVDDDELVLLALAGTPELGLEWGDGGDLRVLIRADDAAAGRWERAWAVGDSG